jgi:3-oxoacyl-[acyl-carrier-protein] synthase II
MLAGSTGTRIHPLKSVQTSMQELCAGPGLDPEKVSRPFDLDRQGMVMGEGAGAILLERRENAVARGATIYGEIIGFGASTVIDADGSPRIDRALENVTRQALETAGMQPGEVGHIHAHGLSCPVADAQEATAIQTVFGDRDQAVPVVAAKSYFGNLGAGSGTVELISSLLAFQHDRLFPVLNYETPDPECPLNVVLDKDTSPGQSVLNLNVSPQAQASSLLIKRC